MAPAQSKMLNPLLSDNACCVVCDTNKQIIECPNGHHQCLKCSMKRYQCVFVNYLKKNREDNIRVCPQEDITCFMCRKNIHNIEDQVDLKVWDKMLDLVILKSWHQTLPAHLRHPLTDEFFTIGYKKMREQTTYKYLED